MLIMVVFIVALLSAVVMGMLQINTEEIQVMQNQVYAAEALAVAEAGLNDAFAEIRDDPGWSSGFSDKSFSGGSYTVTVSGPTVTSIGTGSSGFVAKVEADITVSESGPPYLIKIDTLRINQ